MPKRQEQLYFTVCDSLALLRCVMIGGCLTASIQSLSLAQARDSVSLNKPAVFHDTSCRVFNIALTADPLALLSQFTVEPDPPGSEAHNMAPETATDKFSIRNNEIFQSISVFLRHGVVVQISLTFKPEARHARTISELNRRYGIPVQTKTPGGAVGQTILVYDTKDCRIIYTYTGDQFGGHEHSRSLYAVPRNATEQLESNQSYR